MSNFYYHKATNRIWYNFIMGGNDCIHTPYADIDLSKETCIPEDEIEIVAQIHLYSIYPTVEIISNNNGDLAVMVVYADSGGTGCIKHSVNGAFEYKEVHVFGNWNPGDYNEAFILMRDKKNLWSLVKIFSIKGGTYPTHFDQRISSEKSEDVENVIARYNIEFNPKTFRYLSYNSETNAICELGRCGVSMPENLGELADSAAIRVPLTDIYKNGTEEGLAALMISKFEEVKNALK